MGHRGLQRATEGKEGAWWTTHRRKGYASLAQWHPADSLDQKGARRGASGGAGGRSASRGKGVGT